MTISAFRALRQLVDRLRGKPEPLVRIDLSLWNGLVDELARRGEGWRESGAFLLSDKSGDRRRIVEVAYFDDLDPNSLNGGIHLHQIAFTRLTQICRERQLAIVADIHTHPGNWVSQSGTDKDNPMAGRRGHVALIVPDLARGSRLARDVGVHVYQGDDGWKEHLGRQAENLLSIRRFA